MMKKNIFNLPIWLVIFSWAFLSLAFAASSAEQENASFLDVVAKWSSIQKAIGSLNYFHHQCLESEKALPAQNSHQDPCQVIYDLSENMNNHTRNIPLETALSMLALGAGRSSDFIKYLSENKDQEISKDLVRKKSLKRQLKNLDKMSSEVQQALAQAEKEALAMGSPDVAIMKNIQAFKLEYARLEEKGFRLSDSFEKIKQEINFKNLGKKKINTPFWPLKLLQIAFGTGVLAHEVYLCENKSLSCVIYQILDYLNPLPITDVADGTLTARYEDVPALIVLDVERKLITPKQACTLVKEDKKLLQNFGIVKRLYDEAKHPFNGKLTMSAELKKKSE